MDPIRDLPTAHLQQLLWGVAQNDAPSFNEVVRFYTPRLRSYARTTGYLMEDAEEAIQDTFLSVYKKPSAFDFRSRFSVYLIEILKNKLIDKHRAQKRHNHASDVAELSDTLVDDSISVDPLARAEAVRTSKHYQRCKEKLTAIQTEVLYWMFEMQATETETAAVLKCELGTVKSRFHAARAAMGKCLQHWHREMRHG